MVSSKYNTEVVFTLFFWNGILVVSTSQRKTKPNKDEYREFLNEKHSHVDMNVF